ncbi:MAG: 2-amino-4-hydroxy-6-hydroxymethyldihydropteridine diphosphokinase [Thermodesulfobacteriota bacterium]|nr:2-amino-4-hydroxy-6-hydroxymethyldihydropteridine diphosphokinase [Thermodesulfobacteriota bacterium]
MKGYLCLGSNKGNREKYLARSMVMLDSNGVNILKASRIYETSAVEVNSVQPAYLNMALYISTSHDPMGLLDVCMRAEHRLGRQRPYRHAPRTIDIDILYLEGIYWSDKRLVLPHPGMEKRAFVIFPLCDVFHEKTLPSGKNILDVKKDLGNDEILNIWKMRAD